MPEPTPAQLKAEVDTDASGIGLSFTLSNESVMALLNQARATITFTVLAITRADLVPAINPAEFEALTAVQQRTLLMLLADDRVPLNTATKQWFVSAFPSAAGPTRTATALLLDREGSRAEQLWGEDVTIRRGLVQEAKALP